MEFFTSFFETLWTRLQITEIYIALIIIAVGIACAVIAKPVSVKKNNGNFNEKDKTYVGFKVMSIALLVLGALILIIRELF